MNVRKFNMIMCTDLLNKHSAWWYDIQLDIPHLPSCRLGLGLYDNVVLKKGLHLLYTKLMVDLGLNQSRVHLQRNIDRIMDREQRPSTMGANHNPRVIIDDGCMYNYTIIHETLRRFCNLQ